MNPCYTLLSLCARAHCTDSHYAQIARQASRVQEWSTVPSLAEHHGLAPLLYTHLKAAEVQIPSGARRALQALTLRHRLAHQARERALYEMLTAFANAGMQVFVLKGAALAYLLYEDPALRPMRDVDLLVRQDDVAETQRLLGNVGFSAPVPDVDHLPDRHVGAVRDIDGFVISVEVHHNLFNKEDAPLSMTVNEMCVSPLQFAVGEAGTVAHTLGYEDMLWHLCQHLRLSSGVFGAHRLIWVADIVGFAERFVMEVDWDLVRTRYPLVLKTLSLLHFLTPLSETLLRHADIAIGVAPQGIGADFVGWPRFSVAQQRDKGVLGILRDTWCPSEWWLRLYYGLDSVQSMCRARCLQHPLHICGWIGHFLRERLNVIISI